MKFSAMYFDPGLSNFFSPGGCVLGLLTYLATAAIAGQGFWAIVTPLVLAAAAGIVQAVFRYYTTRMLEREKKTIKTHDES